MKKVLLATMLSLSLFATDIYPVGAVMQALLEEDDFQAQMGTEWVLMDGRPISKSDGLGVFLDGYCSPEGDSASVAKYAICTPDTQISLPDARGKFLRMLDNRAQDKKDLDGDSETNRVLGGYQGDEFKKHTHILNDPGHRHTMTTMSKTGGIYERGSNNSAWGYYSAPNLYTNTVKTGISINENGGTDTRPRNIAINIFVKIKSCSSTQCK